MNEKVAILTRRAILDDTKIHLGKTNVKLISKRNTNDLLIIRFLFWFWKNQTLPSLPDPHIFLLLLILDTKTPPRIQMFTQRVRDDDQKTTECSPGLHEFGCWNNKSKYHLYKTVPPLHNLDFKKYPTFSSCPFLLPLWPSQPSFSLWFFVAYRLSPQKLLRG